jgi:capsular exopolysaccharide synthesis family protein
MSKQPGKLSVDKIRQYFQARKASLLQDINVISYVTKSVPSAGGIDPRVVTLADSKSHISEQFRSIRTNIASLAPEDPIRAFLITSALRGEGKTVTAANLASAFSQEVGKKTVVIDADLRKPNLHKIFNLEREPGLTDILAREMAVERFTGSPCVGDLYVIPSGKAPANPAELIGSDRMRDLIARLKEEFDWIIFDMAPILPVTDAGILGAMLDGSLLIVRASRTQAVDVERAYSMLLEANAKPIASLMTGVVTYIPYYLYRYRYIYSHQYYNA